VLSCAAGESVPFDTLSWTADSATPSEAGISHRAQVYFLVNLEDTAGTQLYWSLRGGYGQRYPTSYTAQVFLIGSKGSMPTRADTDVPDYWDKAYDNAGALLPAFAGGDATGAMVLVDGSGKIVQISRLGANADAERKVIEALFKDTQPLVDNEGAFPLSVKNSIKWLRLGDVNRAMKESQKLGADGMTVAKVVAEQSNRMIETDTKVLEDIAASAPVRMISLLRLGSLLEEFPNAPAHVAAAKAIKMTKGDKQVTNELTAWGALQEYYHSLKRIQAKKVPEIQMQWLPMITAKYSGTYAAEIATMIKHASRLDQ
jgi:hypothetical protein